MRAVATEKPVRLDPEPEQHTFAELIAGREDEFPVLARALKNAAPAYSCRVTWIRPDGRVQFNETQIVRFPYEMDGAAQGAPMAEPSPDPKKDEQLEKFLKDVEAILEHGKPSYRYEPTPLMTCGGFRYFLHRDLEDTDMLSLRVLREPVWRVFTHIGYDREDGPVRRERPIGEWLAEFSLVVYANK